MSDIKEQNIIKTLNTKYSAFGVILQSDGINGMLIFLKMNSTLPLMEKLILIT